MDDEIERLQALRSVYRRNSATLAPPVPEIPESEIVHVYIHRDPTGKDIVLWEDILGALKDADNVRHKTRVLRFLKNERFHTIEPLRIAAMPKTVLDVYVGFQPVQLDVAPATPPPSTSQPVLSTPPLSPPPFQSQPLPVQSASQQSEFTELTERRPQYVSEDVAFLMFDLPTTEPRPPHTTLNNAIGGYQLHSHSSIMHPSVDTNYHSSAVSSTPESASPYVDRIADLISKADRGDMDAQVELGDAYEAGKGLTMDHTNAMKYFRKAANRGHAMAQCRMGLLYLHGRGVEPNPGKAAEWFRKAAGQDLPQAQCQLGLMELNIWRYYYSAMKYFRKAADHGHAESEVHIARLFMRGLGVRRDFEKAMEDDSGYDVAPFEMGMMYYQGLGVPEDFPEAEELFIKASNLGNVDAKRSLGVMYREGREGVAKDPVRAMEWFHKAGDQNDMESQFNLGVMYDNGEGVVRDPSKAMEWYLRAADHQHAEAYFCIGVLYYDGWDGFPRDLAKARKWFYKAAKEKHFEANDYLVKCGGQRVKLSLE